MFTSINGLIKWWLRIAQCNLRRAHCWSNYFFRKFWKCMTRFKYTECRYTSVDVSHDCRSILSNNYTLPFLNITATSDRRAHIFVTLLFSLKNQRWKNNNNNTQTKKQQQQQHHRKQFNVWAMHSLDCAYLIWLKVIFFIEIFLVKNARAISSSTYFTININSTTRFS